MSRSTKPWRRKLRKLKRKQGEMKKKGRGNGITTYYGHSKHVAPGVSDMTTHHGTALPAKKEKEDTEEFNYWKKDECHQGVLPVFNVEVKKDCTLMFFGGGSSRGYVPPKGGLVIDLTGMMTYRPKCLSDSTFSLPGARAYDTIRLDWPDFEAGKLSKPEWELLTAYLKERAASYAKFPVIVACMGGHGRTGTALSILACLNNVVPKNTCPVEFIRATYCKKAVENDKQLKYITKMTGYKTTAKPSKVFVATTYSKGNTFVWPPCEGCPHEEKLHSSLSSNKYKCLAKDCSCKGYTADWRKHRENQEIKAGADDLVCECNHTKDTHGLISTRCFTAGCSCESFKEHTVLKEAPTDDKSVGDEFPVFRDDGKSKEDHAVDDETLADDLMEGDEDPTRLVTYDPEGNRVEDVVDEDDEDIWVCPLDGPTDQTYCPDCKRDRYSYILEKAKRLNDGASLHQQGKGVK